MDDVNKLSEILHRDEKVSWKYHGGYKLRMYVRRFLYYKEKDIIQKSDLNLEDTVSNLLNSAPDTPTNDILEKCSQLLKHQRMLENTRARRRLERWATKVISYYLISVCLVVLLDGASCIYFTRHFLSDYVLTAILTTTTINVIGLGLIVLKGHFKNGEEE